jgi:hypothetical protein
MIRLLAEADGDKEGKEPTPNAPKELPEIFLNTNEKIK